MRQMPKHNTDNEHDGAEEVFLEPKEETTASKIQSMIAAIVAGILMIAFGAGVLALLLAAIYRAFLWIWP